MGQFTEWLKWRGDLQPLGPLLHASHTANKTDAFYIRLMVDGVIEGRTNSAVQQDPVFHVCGYDTQTHTRAEGCCDLSPISHENVGILETWAQQAEQTESSDRLFVVLSRFTCFPWSADLADDITRSAQPATSPRTQTHVHGLFVRNVCVCRVARDWISSPLPGEYVCMCVYLHKLPSTW